MLTTVDFIVVVGNCDIIMVLRLRVFLFFSYSKKANSLLPLIESYTGGCNMYLS